MHYDWNRSTNVSECGRYPIETHIENLASYVKTRHRSAFNTEILLAYRLFVDLISHCTFV